MKKSKSVINAEKAKKAEELFNKNATFFSSYKNDEEIKTLYKLLLTKRPRVNPVLGYFVLFAFLLHATVAVILFFK